MHPIFSILLIPSKPQSNIMLTQNPSTSLQLHSKLSNVLSPCALTWRDRKLMVGAANPGESDSLHLNDFDRLVECLKHSQVEMVKLSPELNSESIIWWANACGKAKKICYVNAPSISEISMNGNRAIRLLSRTLRQLIALIVLIISSPLLLLVAMLSKRKVGSGLNRKWAIGDRGKLFQTWVWNGSGSGKLPALQMQLSKLIHIVRGEMTFRSPTPIVLD